MESGTRPVKGRRKMIANMTPALQPGVFVFCSTFNNEAAGETLKLAKGSFIEDEGMSLILPKGEADRLGLSYDTPMRQITLMVFSSLTGVGLTAAVSGELAREKIPANVVAASQHDHIFVPADKAEAAMEILRALQARAQSDAPRS
ncbi:MAG: ACT domain-containing protein [Silicimonas sp.]|nr:ACT domain-containing protein [Silicimonas sp.]